MAGNFSTELRSIASHNSAEVCFILIVHLNATRVCLVFRSSPLVDALFFPCTRTLPYYIYLFVNFFLGEKFG